jgi:hypothetical protein
MADYTEAEQTLLTQQRHTHSVTDVAVKGTEYDVKTFLSATFYVFHANIETTANATGVKYILQGRPEGSGAGDNDNWVDLATFQTGTTAAVSAAIVAAGEAAAQTQLSVKADPTASFTPGTSIYVHDVSDATKGGWHTVDFSATGGTHEVTVIDGIENALVEDDLLLTEAEPFSTLVDLDGIAYVRGLVLHTAATGSDIEFKMILRVATDIE